MNLSFWESESFLTYDVVIIGAGITGLSSAISLLEKEPNLHVLILEKSIFPSGASTKNAGFACFGSLTELLEDQENMGIEESLNLVQMRWEGLQKLRSRFTDIELGFQQFGGYELLRESEVHFLDKMDALNKQLAPIFNTSVFLNATNKIDSFGFQKSSFSGMIFNPLEGQIDTGKTLSALWKRANLLGAKILTGTKAKSIKGNEITVENGSQNVVFSAKKIAVCTNAFTKELFPELQLVPGRGQVLITQPIPNLKFQGTFHMEAGYYYFRNVGNRVLLGGGRNLDMLGEETTEQGINKRIEKHLIHILKTELLPITSFEIDQQWSGIMAFGEVKKPILEWVSPHTFVAVRLGGMGMALGSLLGERVSTEILSS